MSESVDINLIDLTLFSTLLIIPGYLLWQWKLIDLSKTLLTSVVRMAVQLLLVGLYLKYLFELNNIWLNLGWLLVMVTVANISILKGARLVPSRLFAATQISLIIAVIGTCLIFLIVLVRPEPFLDARYLIPVSGMLLGNVLQGNIRALETFFTDMHEKEASYHADLLIGATVIEASLPFFRKAMRAAITPIIGSMATIGIVSLPGMMTGQILGGAVPLTAAKYQIAIMMGIFLSSFIAIALNIRLSMRVAFDEAGLLRQDIFASKQR